MGDPELVSYETIRRAGRLLAQHLPPSRVVWAEAAGLLLKDEGSLPTGSFKVRGALNRLMTDAARARRQGVVAASAGNHGLGVAYAARLLGAPAQIVVPAGAVAVKVTGIRSLGAEVIQVAGGYATAEAFGRRLAQQQGAIWVSPYNDPRVISGQGVVGLELVDQVEAMGEAGLSEVYIPVGGGGLAAGIGIVLKRRSPATRVIGTQPEASPFMAVEFGGGDRTRVVEGPTVADGLAGDVESGSVTIALVRRVVDSMVLVGENEIRAAMGWAWQQAGLRIEPSAAVALAGCLCYGRGRCAVIISGSNADPSLLAACGVPAGDA